jgi:hypothetical protein
MSRTIKISTLNQAEDYINRQNRELQRLEAQLSKTSNEARRAAQQEANQRIAAERKENEKRLNNEINSLNNKLHNELNAEKKQRIQMEIRHQQQLKQQAEAFYQRLEADIADIKDWTEGKVDELEQSVRRQLADVFEQFSEQQNQIEAIQGNVDYLMKQDAKRKYIFESLHSRVLTEASALLKEMAQNRYTAPADEEDERLEVDYWTNGRYSALENKAKEMEKELREKKDDMGYDITRLKEIAGMIAAIRKERNELVIEALKLGNASEERVRISENIINALLEIGWEIKHDEVRNEPANNFAGSETEATDAREGVYAILTGPNGEEVTVLINTNEAYCPVFTMQRNDNLPKTEAQMRSTLNEIKKQVAKSGINMGDFATPAGTGDNKQPELADPQALARAGKKQQLKQRLGVKI